MATQTPMTAEQFDRMPYDEGRRPELLDGELIEVSTATAKHNEILANLLASVKLFMREHRLGTVIPTTEFAFGEDRLQPDLAVLSQPKWEQVNREKVPVLVPPDIAVEIVSPSESAKHLNRKVTVYLDHGVAEAWVIYPDEQHVLIYTAAPQIRRLHGNDVLECALLPGWSVPLSEIFAV